MIGRISLTLVLAAYGVAALGNGLDRVSDREPDIERVVYPPFRAQADRAAVAIDLTRGKVPEAVRHAQAATWHDPVDADVTGALGAALLASGDLDGAARAFRIAARFGWRNLATQHYWYAAALEAGDLRVAADRADAVLRTHPGFAERNALLEPLESDPAARAIFVQHVRQMPNWLNQYLVLPSDFDDAIVERRVAVITQAGAGGTPLGCDRVVHFTRALLDRNRRGEAERVWNVNCPERRVRGLLADPQFAMVLKQEKTPFGWRIAPSGDHEIRGVDTGAGTHVLMVRNSASTTQQLFYQPVAFAPGVYRLRLMIDGDAKAAAGRLAFSFGCDRSSPFPARPDGDPVIAGQTIRVGDCPRGQLGLWLQPGEEPVLLRSVELEKTG